MFIKILMVWKLLELYTKNCKKKKKKKKKNQKEFRFEKVKNARKCNRC